jgi:alkane 1-monooxygenase
MVRALPHTIGFVLPVALVAGAAAGGLWTLLPVGLLYVGIPIVDALIGRNPENPAPDADAALTRNPWFRLVTWLWVPTQFALIAWTIAVVAQDTTTMLERGGLILSLGVTCGAIGITFAHELIHRPGRWERALGEALLASVSYPHFAIEHVLGHHRSVATREDPATARYGETLYGFLPRTVAGSLRSAWRLEALRLRKRGRSTWSLSNRFLRYAATQAAVYLLVGIWLGPLGAIAFAGQAAVAVALLETINYIEHYGLERRELAPGRYEPVMPWHSWNSCHRVSNWMLINLARHADHHLVASKRYQILDHLDAAPELPAGYGTMFVAAMLPPVWHRMMDPRVEAWRRRYFDAGAEGSSTSRETAAASTAARVNRSGR